jgi:hypothetical protein
VADKARVGQKLSGADSAASGGGLAELVINADVIAIEIEATAHTDVLVQVLGGIICIQSLRVQLASTANAAWYAR